MDEPTGDAGGRTESEPGADLPGPPTSEGVGTPVLPSDGPQPADGSVESGPTPTTPKRRTKRTIAVLASTLAVIGVVVGVLVATVGSTPNADAAVVTAIDSAMGQKTAHVAVSGSIVTAGKAEPLAGTGVFDFTDNAQQMNLNLQIEGQQVDVQAVYLGGTIYEGLPEISQLAPGKNWVSIDLSSLQQTADRDAASQLGGNPIATLHALASQGNAVTDLGSSVVDGVSVQGYAVTVDPAVVKRDLAQSDLPAWLKQLASNVTLGSATQDVYLDGGGNLVRLSSDVTETAGSAGTVKVQESLDFSDFGAPVSITTPPADQVIPFSQFLQLAGQSQAS